MKYVIMVMLSLLSSICGQSGEIKPIDEFQILLRLTTSGPTTKDQDKRTISLFLHRDRETVLSVLTGFDNVAYELIDNEETLLVQLISTHSYIEYEGTKSRVVTPFTEKKIVSLKKGLVGKLTYKGDLSLEFSKMKKLKKIVVRYFVEKAPHGQHYWSGKREFSFKVGRDDHGLPVVNNEYIGIFGK